MSRIRTIIKALAVVFSVEPQSFCEIRGTRISIWMSISNSCCFHGHQHLPGLHTTQTCPFWTKCARMQVYVCSNRLKLRASQKLMTTKLELTRNKPLWDLKASKIILLWVREFEPVNRASLNNVGGLSKRVQGPRGKLPNWGGRLRGMGGLPKV